MITAERLRELLSYDPETGVFMWRSHGTGHPANLIAGCTTRTPGSASYRHIRIKERQYKAHRLAWLYVTGEWPAVIIDHINGDGLDNRFCNLREATHSQNGGNRRAPRTTTSGFKGVSWREADKRWRAQIKVGGRDIHLGVFDSPEAAHAAYVRAAIENFGEYARAQ